MTQELTKKQKLEVIAEMYVGVTETVKLSAYAERATRFYPELRLTAPQVEKLVLSYFDKEGLAIHYK